MPLHVGASAGQTPPPPAQPYKSLGGKGGRESELSEGVGGTFGRLLNSANYQSSGWGTQLAPHVPIHVLLQNAVVAFMRFGRLWSMG